MWLLSSFSLLLGRFRAECFAGVLGAVSSPSPPPPVVNVRRLDT